MYLSHTWRILAVCRTHAIHEPIKPTRHKSIVAQWLKHPTVVPKIIGSIPVRGSGFFFLTCARAHVDYIIFHFFTELKFTIICLHNILFVVFLPHVYVNTLNYALIFYPVINISSTCRQQSLYFLHTLHTAY